MIIICYNHQLLIQIDDIHSSFPYTSISQLSYELIISLDYHLYKSASEKMSFNHLLKNYLSK